MPEALDMINLTFLSESEQELILQVLRRDEELRQAEEQRVRKLKSELLEVKRKGAKRGSGRYSQHTCGRCQESLSRLTFLSSQCKMCHHYVCRNCQTVLPNGSWLCSVCTKESDMKKKTGEWFYDKRINRFTTAPGHDLVRFSLKKRPPLKKHETAGDTILRITENVAEPPKPVPMPRLKNQPVSKSHSTETSGSVTSKESLELRNSFSSKPAHSDTESAENGSIASNKTETESGRVTPEQPRSEHDSVPPYPAGSSVSSLTVPVKADVVKADVVTTDGANPGANIAVEVKPVAPSPELEVDRLFKKSVRRDPRPGPGSESVSTLDLRVASETSMGKRSHSVPGLDLQEDIEEEDEEDIDSLVSFHRSTMASSSSSLQSLKSTQGSMMSIYSEAGDFGSVEVSGDVSFSVSYNERTKSLQLLIKECHGLAYGDASRKLSNPYVKCYLLPDKSRQSKKKTSIKRNTINPVYNETLKYSIIRPHLVTRSVLISVWHHGRLSRNVFLGEVEVPLDCRDLDSSDEDRMQLMGKVAAPVPTSAFAQYKGELVISLKYVPPKKRKSEKVKGKKAAPEEGELHILIKEAKNLTAMKPGGTSDSFVKGYLFPTKAKTSKRKTAVVKKSLNPHYDATFVYKELAPEQLRGMCLELTVWDKEAMLSNEFLGGLRLSSGKGTIIIEKEEVELDSVGEEISLWQKMMQYPDSWAEGTLPLRSTMGKGKAK